MFGDDVRLVAEMVAKHGPGVPGSIVDIGGLVRPCVAEYQKTIDAMAALKGRTFSSEADYDAAVREAQLCRYLDIENPLSFLGAYECENPETGGLPIDRLHEKYPRSIGLAICLSVLEHVDCPWTVDEDLHLAVAPGGLLIVSVPWEFPWHGPVDHWRFSPTGLRRIFEGPQWNILEAGPRLNIDADAGVLELHTGRPQAIRSSYLVARAT